MEVRDRPSPKDSYKSSSVPRRYSTELGLPPDRRPIDYKSGEGRHHSADSTKLSSDKKAHLHKPPSLDRKRPSVDSKYQTFNPNEPKASLTLRSPSPTKSKNETALRKASPNKSQSTHQLEERPSSPRSSSSCNSSGPSQPLSPARGPSRRPMSPSQSTPTSVKPSPIDDTDSPISSREKLDLKRLEMSLEEVISEEKKVWTRSAPADLYYERDMENPRLMRSTPRLDKLLDRFDDELVKSAEKIKQDLQGNYQPPKPPRTIHRHGCCDKESDSSGSSDDEEEESNTELVKNESVTWMEHRANQPFRLSPDLWDNRSQELNDGPACRCSQKARKIGIRHGIFPGEEVDPPTLDPTTNNADKLYHYRVTISPPTNFLVKHPTTIHHDQHEFIFEGFSLFTTKPLKELPVCHVVRFSIKYSILYFEEKYPDNVTLRELQLFEKYFFQNILELVDWDVKGRFFFMPRFVRELSENGKEILSMNQVISYLIKSFVPVIEETELMQVLKLPRLDWQNSVTEKVKGMLVTHPGMAPAALRVDQLDREQKADDVLKFPDLVHFGTRPQQLCYAGNAQYQKSWREYVKYRHLLANMPKPTSRDKRQLLDMEENLNSMRSTNTMKRDIASAISCQGFIKTGLMTDIVQHGLLLPVLVHHLRLHSSLDHFEEKIGYQFKNRNLLQLAMTHPSYKENFGTNPDHVRNTLSNCGIRQPEYGDKKVYSATTRKRGINMLISIMSRFGKRSETESKVAHNERLEFLGDAVVEFITSVHLFHMFPDLEEGGLATYRAALVQNQHLAVLAEALNLEDYMLYAHGSDLCHDAEMRHAMANCFEALMGAIYLDSGINEADKVFSKALFGTDQILHDVWTNLDAHPLQCQEPNGDRHWISSYPVLEKLVEFENSCGIEFNHIRLLARAFSDRSLGSSNLTMGSNQRLEFLGDTVLQLVTSDYLYRHFPEHHEGHLSLLRSSIVNNRTQAVVCDDLDIPKYAMFAVPKKELKMKDRADLLEAFLGALYVDKDLEYCRVFTEVCFFPRLQQFIINQEWNDPKSKLQQCCLTLRTMTGNEPDIPVYKVIEAKGPTNTRVYTVAVYFRDKRLAKAEGHSIQSAEMAAAALALENCESLFPHLSYQKRIVEKSLQRQTYEEKRQAWTETVLEERKRLGLDKINAECQKRNAERLAGHKKVDRKRKANNDSVQDKSYSQKKRRSQSHHKDKSSHSSRSTSSHSKSIRSNPMSSSYSALPRSQSVHRSHDHRHTRYKSPAKGDAGKPPKVATTTILPPETKTRSVENKEIKSEITSPPKEKKKREEPLEEGECSDDDD